MSCENCDCTCENEKIPIIKGQSETLEVFFQDEKCLPDDLTNAEIIQVQFKTLVSGIAGVLNKWRLKKVSDTSIGSDIVAMNTDNVSEGLLVNGTGIPLNSTILKTPFSTTSPTAPGTVKISANATANGVGVELILGDIEFIGDPLLGHIRVSLSTLETPQLNSGSFYARRVVNGDDKYVKFSNVLDIQTL